MDKTRWTRSGPACRRSLSGPVSPLSAALTVCIALSAVLPRPGAAIAEPGEMPVFMDINAGIRKPDLSGIDRLRFLTTVDFPPFNFVDTTGHLSGFNVELTRAICDELGITARCEIQAIPWPELESALRSGQGEAVIAGWHVSERLRSAFGFTDAYVKLPARFAVRLESEVSVSDAKSMADKKIGVMDNSAHEAMLRAYFPEAQVTAYTRQQWLYEDLAKGKTDAIFGDGMEISFWLSGKESAGCCRFEGGPYFSSRYLGEGLAIAVPRERRDILQALSFALQEAARKGRLNEIYQRYFPRSFY